MTSRIKYIFPACLMVFVLSLAFVNVAYADNPIWHESVNLYKYQPVETTFSSPANPYGINLTPLLTDLEPGEKYSISFEIDSESSHTNYVRLEIDGQTSYISKGQGNQYSFDVPEEYSTIRFYLQSPDYIPASSISRIMLNKGNPLPYEPYYSGFRFDFAAIAQLIGQYVQPVIIMILPYIFLMIALIIGINAGIRVFRKTAT